MISKRKVLLKIFYDGQYYHGLAYQTDKNSVSGEILKVLKSINLIKSIDESEIEYAGRTDSGVSAVGMVISIFLYISENMKIDLILNDKLPYSIRILGYCYVDDLFSARFNCILREYRYYFNKIDTKKMKECVEKIKNIKNYKYLCKRSKEKEFKKKNILMDDSYYNRNIEYINIVEEKNINYLEIGGRSFLHNMVRKIFYLISNGDMNIIDKLIENKEVQIGTAEPYPLVFYNAKYNEEIKWIVSERTKEENKKIKERKNIEFEKYKFLN
ncbi:Pseudouridylate synthase [Spraguea lophii 42_110]|uniref:tRNA pseudouridine synthase n=1 Tax=Spraguea lophii (strain 42_110) TaxID=1358809 RepID=S7XK88_SPRLO|nr:Pseudouridylate synthase [Spraguea lophii 42_110]